MGIEGQIRPGGAEVMAVGDVEGSVAGLDDAGVMVTTGEGAWGVVFEGPAMGPGETVVVGEHHHQAVAAGFGVIADEEPASVVQDHAVGAGARIGDVGIGDGGPGEASVAGFALGDAFGRGTVVAHVGDQRAIAALKDVGLDIAAAEQWGGGGPGDAVIVGDGHEGAGETVVVEGQDDAMPFVEVGMGAGHPAQAQVQLVLDLVAEDIEVTFDLAAHGIGHGIGHGIRLEPAFDRGEPGLDGLMELGSRGDVKDAVLFPAGRTRAFEIVADPVFEEGAFPEVGEDGGPDEPEAALSVEEEGAVGVGVAGGVGEEERFAPGIGPAPEAGTADHDVVGATFAGAVEPADQEITPAGFDDGGTMVVPVFGREDEAGVEEGGVGVAGSRGGGRGGEMGKEDEGDRCDEGGGEGAGGRATVPCERRSGAGRGWGEDRAWRGWTQGGGADGTGVGRAYAGRPDGPQWDCGAGHGG